MTTPEIWKPIPSAYGRYEASSFGRIRSVDFFDGRRRVTGRVLKPATMKSGHQQVMLGRGVNRLVHRCVAEAFLGFCPLLQEVLHGDHNPQNNAVSNLKYGTRSENIRMDYAAGTRVTSDAWKYSPNKRRTKSVQEYLCTS